MTTLYICRWEIFWKEKGELKARWTHLRQTRDVTITVHSQREKNTVTKQPIRFQGLFKVTNEITGKWQAKKAIVWRILQLLFKTLLYISFGCGCNKIELSGVEFVVVVVVVVVAQLSED